MKTDRMLSASFAQPSRTSGGFALVIVMFLLALILILVIAFAANMRTERKAAHNMAQGQRADLLAEGALAHAVSLLANNIPDPTDPTVATPAGTATNWLINPGQLTLIDSASPPNVTRIPLHSGTASAPNSIAAANLNAQSPSTQRYYITGTNDPMWVSWVNVLQDASAPASQTNQIVGRYAFWIDDECAKINFNTARGKTQTVFPDVASGTSQTLAQAVGLPANWSGTSRDLHTWLNPLFKIGSKAYSLGQSASVNLDILGIPSSEIATLDADVSANGFFTQPQAIKSYASADPDTAAAFYEQNKFQLTPFSRSPEFNVFGKSRFFMGGAGDLATGAIYQHAPHPEQPYQFWSLTAGAASGTDHKRTTEMRAPPISAIARYLNRNDWPGMGNSQFRWTSATNGAEESDQIALNIGMMGYWATTQTHGSISNGERDMVKAYADEGGAILDSYDFSGSVSAPHHYLWKGPVTERPMLPPFPAGPSITEVACTLTPVMATGTSYYLSFNFEFELYQPAGNISDETYGIPGWRNAGSSTYKLMFYPTNVEITTVSGTVTHTNVMNYDHSGTIGLQRTWSATTALEMVPRDDYLRIATGPVYMSKGALPIKPATSGTSRAVFLNSSGTTTVTIKARYCLATEGLKRIVQSIPVYVPAVDNPPSEMLPPADANDAYLQFTFAVPPAPSTAGYTRSREANDPRVVANNTTWPIHPVSGGPDDESLGFPNTNADYSTSEATQWAMWRFDSLGTPKANGSRTIANPNFRGSSIGMFSFVPTGMQRGISFDSLRFYKAAVPGELPDWAILDLLAPIFDDPISLRNSTAGKINLNTKIYPEGSNFAPAPRTAPLDALFQHMPNGTQAAAAIRSHQAGGGYFDYIGRICELPGVADSSFGPTEYEMEVLLRHLASLMTTQSNTFSIWGVSQTVKKAPKNSDYGVFEDGDSITGERRFRAVVERYVWAGKEGVPGNASVDSSGQYGLTATVASGGTKKPGAAPISPYFSGSWAAVDGPHEPESVAAQGEFPWNSTSLDSASNPMAAAMKYRVIYWEYLD